MEKTISIIGAGWVGLPLAHQLKQRGYTIKVSTTQKKKAAELENQGLEAYCLQLDPKPEAGPWDQFLACDILILSIPPGVRHHGPAHHPQQIKELLSLLPSVPKVIYTGSTGVFEDHGGEEVDEQTTPRITGDRSQALGGAENILRTHLQDRFTLLRFGGLMGYDRIPGRFSSSNKPVRSPEDRVNFVHRDDAVGLLETIIRQDAWGNTFHAVAPVPATRREVYEAAARQGGWDSPTFENATSKSGHVVLAQKTQQALHYEYHYPDPTQFSYDFSKQDSKT